MRTNFVVASAACVAALAGWWARGIEWDPIDSSPITVVSRAPIASNHADALPALAHHTASPHPSHSSRNLFAYREEAFRAPAVIEHVAYVAPPPVVVAREEVKSEAPPRLRFVSRYIGLRAGSQSHRGVLARWAGRHRARG